MPAPKFLGNHMFFAVAATSTSSATVKPAAGSFVTAGKIQRLRFTPQVEMREIIAPNPGQLARIDVLPTKKTLDFSVSLIEVGPLFWQLVFGSLPIAAGNTQYNPGSGNGTAKGWVKIQQYDENNVLYNAVDLWSILTVDAGVDFGDNAAEAEISGRVIFSALNTGQFAGLA